MYNEQQQIIDGAYENYVKKTNEDFIKSDITLPPSYYPIDKDKFINKCKTDPEFSERWGLKIEERELSLDERNEWFKINLNGNNLLMKSDWKDFELDQQNIPTRLITITYNDKTVESYE